MKNLLLIIMFAVFSVNAFSKNLTLKMSLDTGQGDFELSFRDPEILKKNGWSLQPASNSRDNPIAAKEVTVKKFEKCYVGKITGDLGGGDMSIVVKKQQNKSYRLCVEYDFYDGGSTHCTSLTKSVPTEFLYSGGDGQHWNVQFHIIAHIDT